MRCHRWPEVQALVERMHASVVGKMEEHRDEPARRRAAKHGERIFAAHRANEEVRTLTLTLTLTLYNPNPNSNPRP